MAASSTIQPWGCVGGECIDVKRWYMGVITPEFKTPGGRERIYSRDMEDPSLIPGNMSLLDAMQTLRKNTQTHNQRGYTPLGDRPNLQTRFFGPLEAHSVRTCICSLAATALGAGALALPYAFSLTGIGLGLVTMTFAGAVSALSLQVLMVGARYTDTKSYAAVLELSGGSSRWSVALDSVLLMNGVGSVVCCLIFLSDFLPSICLHPPAALGLSGMVLPRSTAVMMAAVAVWPLTLSSDISALRYVSLAVPSALLLTIAIVMTDVPELHRNLRESGDRVKLWDFDLRRWLQAVAIMINAFANHMNAIPCVNQLERPSVARIVKSTVYGNFLVWLLLSGLGLAGYMSWGAATKGDFLLNYPGGLPEIWLCKVMLSLIVYFVLPVALFPTARSGAQLAITVLGLGSTGGGDDDDDDDASAGEVSPRAQATAATVLLSACMLIALNITDVASVVGVLGGLFASSLMFWFPAVVFRRLLWNSMPKIFRGYVLFFMLVLGILGWASVGEKFI